MLLHEAEDSRLSPQEHRGPFQNGDTESLRDAGSTGRAWGGSVWKDPSVRGVRAGESARHAPRVGGARGAVAKGTERLAVSLSPSGHLFLVFWNSQGKGMEPELWPPPTSFSRPRPLRFQHRQGFREMRLLIPGDEKSPEAERSGRRPGPLSREHGGRGRGSALASCRCRAEQEPPFPLRRSVPGPECRDTVSVPPETAPI